MDNQTQLARVLAGAAIGAGFAFFFLTDRGRRLLGDAEPRLDEMLHDLGRLRNAAGKAIEVFDEGRRSFAVVSGARPFGGEAH